MCVCVPSIRKCRRAGIVGLFVSVFVNDIAKCVHVACDGGRICRPLIVVENGKPRLTVSVVFHASCVDSCDACIIV